MRRVLEGIRFVASMVGISAYTSAATYNNARGSWLHEYSMDRQRWAGVTKVCVQHAHLKSVGPELDLLICPTSLTSSLSPRNTRKSIPTIHIVSIAGWRLPQVGDLVFFSLSHRLALACTGDITSS